MIAKANRNAPLAVFVRAARARSGLSQKAFAEALGTSERNVQNWERGLSAPQGANYRRLTISGWWAEDTAATSGEEEKTSLGETAESYGQEERLLRAFRELGDDKQVVLDYVVGLAAAKKLPGLAPSKPMESQGEGSGGPSEPATGGSAEGAAGG